MNGDDFPNINHHPREGEQASVVMKSTHVVMGQNLSWVA